MLLKSGTLFRIIWKAIIVIITIFITIEIPVIIVFNLEASASFIIIDIIVLLFFIADIFINFNTSIIKDRKEIEDKKIIAHEYKKTTLYTDIISALPLHLIFLLTGLIHLYPVLKLIKLLRLFKLQSAVQAFRKIRESNIFNPSVFRMFLLTFWIIISAHLISICWIFISGNPNNLINGDLYLRSLYWTITTITTIGYGDITPSTNTQILFVIIVELIGAGMYGFIIGNIANLIANIDVAKTQFREKKENINTFMKYRNLPSSLQKRINDYYNYLWDNRRGYDESTVLEDLPISLKTSVSLYINKEIIEKVPMFKGASSEFIKEIIMNLEPVIFTPNDYVVTMGEIGYEMYFISKGSVNVVSEDEQTIYATLGSGNFFGEIALLLRTPRTATIKAIDYCDLYALNKETFERVLEKYPDFATSVRDLAQQRRSDLYADQEESAETIEMEKTPCKEVPDKIRNIEYIIEKKSICLKWENIKDSSYYEIAKQESAGKKWMLLNREHKSNDFTDLNPAKNKNNIYLVRAVNSKGAGPWSHPISVKFT